MSIGDFVVKSLQSYDYIIEIVGKYGLTQDESRITFDPKGYIERVRDSQKLCPIEHMTLLIDDLIRNLEMDEVVSIKKKYKNVERDFKQIIRKIKINIDPLSGIIDPLTKALKLLEEKYKILNNVPDACYNNKW